MRTRAKRKSILIFMMNPMKAVDSYREIKKLLGRKPDTVEFSLLRADDIPCADTIRKIFGSWGDFVEICEHGLQDVCREPVSHTAVCCNYNGIMIHYSKEEYERLQAVKVRRAKSA